MQNQRFEWSKEEEAKIQYALIAQQKETMEKLERLRQTSTQQSQANELAMRLAEAEETQRKFKNYQDEVMKGTVQPQWMYGQQQQMPQLGYQQMPQLGYLQMPQLGYQQSSTNKSNTQMHKRPQVKQWVRWPESKADSMRSSLDEQSTRQVHYTKSDSGSDSPDTKRALKELRRKRKDAKQAKKEKSHRRESKRSHRSRTPDQDDLQDRKRRRNDSDSSKGRSD